jgi:hypothetical protein
MDLPDLQTQAAAAVVMLAAARELAEMAELALSLLLTQIHLQHRLFRAV